MINVGCRLCELACPIPNIGETNPPKSRIRIVKIEEEAESLSIPVVYMKCGEAARMAVCPRDLPVTGSMPEKYREFIIVNTD